MGLLVLHSAHFSKIFRRLMGTTCSLAWRNSGDTELVWTVNPSHPITAGIPQPIVITEHEMYGEFFDIPAPDELIFLSTFSGGEVFRSGCCWRRGKGKVFYFSPGDQAYPIYHRVIDACMRRMAPPGEHVGRRQDALVKAVLWLILSSPGNRDGVAQHFSQAGSDCAVHSVGVALGHSGLVAFCPLVKVLAPDSDADR